MIKASGFVILLLIVITIGFGQNIYTERTNQFLAYKKIPAWTCVASNWSGDYPKIHIYNSEKYKGHADFVSTGLMTGISFKEFKNKVKYYDSREYLPFFLFDLREQPVNLNGELYTWAVRIEDYAYQDTPRQMSETALKLMQTVSAYIETQAKEKSRGIIILATNPNSMPNKESAAYLNEQGFPNLTRSELLAEMGGEKLEILNPVNSIGYLRYVKAGQEDVFKPDYTDILIYEQSPKRIWPVSGIITKEPQTPLSHINLLAKNRGTLNLYTLDLNYIPGLQDKIGKLVKFSFIRDRIYLSEVTTTEAEKFWSSMRKKIEIPAAETSLTGLVDLNKKDTLYQQTRYIGAKASNYALIRQAYPEYVREAYAIPFKYYFELINECGADTLIDQLHQSGSNNEKLADKLKEIRRRIKSTNISKVLLNELRILIDSMKCVRIRLRSSTNCEDLPDFNGAGLYQSTGFNTTDDNVKLEEKIRKVYASLWTELAYKEREYHFIDHTKAGMSILINEAFTEEYANGVSVSYKGNLILNTQYGEQSVTNPEKGQIPESIRFRSKNVKYELMSGSSVHNIFLQDEMHEILEELKNLLYNIHTTFVNEGMLIDTEKYGVDTEFKIMRTGEEYKIYIKQARLLKSVLPE